MVGGRQSGCEGDVSCRSPRASACICRHASSLEDAAVVVANTASNSRTSWHSAVCLFRRAELIGMIASMAGAENGRVDPDAFARAGLRGRSEGHGRNKG